MNPANTPTPANQRLVERARHVAYVVGCVRGPLLTAVAFAAVLTVVGRLSLAFGFEAELLQALGFGWAVVRLVASIRRSVMWLQGRWRTYSTQ